MSASEMLLHFWVKTKKWFYDNVMLSSPLTTRQFRGIGPIIDAKSLKISLKSHVISTIQNNKQ